MALISKIESTPTAQNRFNAAYSDIEIEWETVYQLPFKLTTDTKSHQFQYKLLNRVLYTNKMLFKMNIKESEKCTFCNEIEET